MSATVRVYVNGTGVDAPASGAPVDAVRLVDPSLADAIVAGQRLVTDSRGLPVAAGESMYHGAIYRVIANRPRHADRPAHARDAMDAPERARGGAGDGASDATRDATRDAANDAANDAHA